MPLHIPCYPRVPTLERKEYRYINPVRVATITQFECHIWNLHEIWNMLSIVKWCLCSRIAYRQQ